MEKSSIADPTLAFGKYPDSLELPGSGFYTEMHQYRHVSYGEKHISLNILHVSTDLKAVSNEMTKITRFLESRGFSHECIRDTKCLANTDLLIVGSDKQHSKNAVNIAKYLSFDCGIVMPLDVLLYGLWGKIETDIDAVDRPLLTDKCFGTDGVCMAHSRIRRWIDNIVIIGIITSKIISIENCIDVVMGSTGHCYPLTLT